MCVVTVGMLSAPVGAVSEDLTGEEILDRIEQESAVTEGGTGVINLITENKRGEQRSSTVRMYRKESNGTEKQLLEYLEPADVKGTKFLSITEEGKEALMYIYFPFLGRERRIAAGEESDSFMGTDFTYEEMGSGQTYQEEYDASRLKDEVLEEYPCYVLRLTPQEEDSDYTYIKMWVWQEEFLVLRIEFYEEGDRLTKALSNSDIREEEEGEFMPHRIVMADEIKGTKTIIEIIETKEEELSEDYFTLRYLRR
jgi:outer membrane lipoprotein-sorting protein